jgi:recombination protein RecR
MSDPLLPAAISDLVSAFSALPGIGAKTARRLAFHLVDSPPEKTRQLLRSLSRLEAELGHCPTCGFFSRPQEPCVLCTSNRRQPGQLCVVGRIQDVLAIEEAGVFHGRYHVLGGYISPLNQVFPEELRLSSLLERVAAEHITEVILAFDAVSDADYTAHYLLDLLPSTVRVHRIAAGIPFGGELEYTDGITLSHAFTLKRELPH